MVDPVASNRKRKVIEAAEPTDRRPTLSDVHIFDAEDSHPNTVSPFRMQPPNPSLRSIVINSSRCFPPWGSRWRIGQRDDPSPWILCSWKGGSNPCRHMIDQTDRSTTGVAIFSHCGKKRAGPSSPTHTQGSTYLSKARGASDQRPTKMKRTLQTLGVPETRSSLALRIKWI